MYKTIIGTVCGLALNVQAFSVEESLPVVSRQINLDKATLSVDTQGHSIGASLSVTYNEGSNPTSIVMHGDREWTLGGAEGSATVEFSLDGDGKPIETAVIKSSNEQIAEVALNAVQKSTFSADGGKARHQVTYAAKLNKQMQPSAEAPAD